MPRKYHDPLFSIPLNLDQFGVLPNIRPQSAAFQFPFSLKNTVNHEDFVYTLDCSSPVSFDIPLFSAICLTPVIAGLWLELNTDK